MSGLSQIVKIKNNPINRSWMIPVVLIFVSVIVLAGGMLGLRMRNDDKRLGAATTKEVNYK
ncbi:hypothetical protein A2397_05575 [Candidatus Amesbacteria bacterium RIFOXYB1_FULL_44_23]|uniref:Uncharacterized protein n=1 Tax=Candidatus Amesbacteria bacterium RIFOXYB1_FULL_44_23 TaxID=1797263 RepID=A0A1F4ZPE3_9BACT|nr:MAG: hypothetical protein A2397_05575 [Candidatus Amesbacteria bacterium RIFOXYB1_FULL_44_23]